MKNIKLILLALTAMLFLGMRSVSAQEKSILIRAELNGIDYNITTIQPNYEVTVVQNKRDKTFTDVDFLLLLKKEMDKYFASGYTLKESTVSPYYGDRGNYILYVLTKKE
ncbi:MAG: hypothetical protein R2779_04310 [Crocinitomicaceae bacterium]